MKQTWSKDEANLFNIHMHNVCSKFASCLVPLGLLDESFVCASCLLYRVNRVLV